MIRSPLPAELLRNNDQSSQSNSEAWHVTKSGMSPRAELEIPTPQVLERMAEKPPDFVLRFQHG
jgi:hypothetical protein